MNDRMLVDRKTTLTHTANLHQTAGSLDALQQDFDDKVQSLVEEPGNDLISPLIWAAHDAVRGILQKCVSSNVHGIRSHADKWTTRQQLHDAVEKVNIQQARNSLPPR
ncbi:hypothetical protein AB0L00_19300 [Actinoallomurus sp. NPDC052308]|uniref:hypothetical protein n=1 Tax=Actinoallomurus sp. NPDC052308 TaxID=3155530 RepID=UPI0034496396